MTGRTVLVTGATGGIGKATALGLAAMGAHLAITGRDPGRTEAAAREIRAAGGGPVDVFVADLSAQAEVRRLADEVLQRLPRLRRAGQQRRRLLEHPARHRRRARAHLRPQPSRAVPAHQPAAGPADAEHPRPRGHRRLPRPHAWGGSTSTTCRANGPTPAPAPTTSPSSRTCCSPTSWPGGCTARRSPPMRCTPAWCSTSFGAEDPGGAQRLLVPLIRPFMKSPARGAATSIHLASAPELEQVTGRYFANSKPEEVLRAQLRRGGRRAAVAGERRPGRPDRGRLTHHRGTSS